MTKGTKGTKEWAYKNLNFVRGCPYNCTYCYAKRMALRFGRIKNEKEWGEWELVPKKIKKGYRMLKNPTNLHTYMSPTSHDIFLAILPAAITIYKKVLKAGNTLLITTKPNPICIKKLCMGLMDWKDQIMFRFTITSNSGKTLKTCEPYAPALTQRIKALKCARNVGFRTSVSVEPFLDYDPVPLIDRIEKFVNDTIWIGPMSGKIPSGLKKNYEKRNLIKIKNELETKPYRKKIRFKDSFLNKINVQKTNILNYIKKEGK
ncbi:MAG: radical SAM protein [Promethearchaeota archaeon]